MSKIPNAGTVWRALQKIMDPELPISIVDLGLVYGVRVRQNHVDIDLTFTATACPAMDMLIGDIRETVASLPGVTAVEVNVVWNPPWNKSKLTPQGKEVLQSFGIAV